jgi:hypothetical protein
VSQLDKTNSWARSGPVPIWADHRSLVRDTVLVVAALTAGLVATPILNAALSAGLNMAPHDLATDYVMGALWATALGIAILVWPVPFASLGH